MPNNTPAAKVMTDVLSPPTQEILIGLTEVYGVACEQRDYKTCREVAAAIQSNLSNYAPLFIVESGLNLSTNLF